MQGLTVREVGGWRGSWGEGGWPEKLDQNKEDIVKIREHSQDNSQEKQKAMESLGVGEQRRTRAPGADTQRRLEREVWN